MYQNTNGNWCRTCPKCKQEITYHSSKDGGKWKCGKQEKSNSPCRKCYEESVKISPEEKMKRKREQSQKYTKENYKYIQNRKKDYYNRHPEKLRDKHLKSKYGITFEEYKEMFDKQAGLCAICGLPETNGKSLAVDHCHITGKVRALLC